MPKFDLVTVENFHLYPGHVIEVRGTTSRITGIIRNCGLQIETPEEPLESSIHRSLLLRQRTALPIAIRDDEGLWPDRLGTLLPWSDESSSNGKTTIIANA